MFALSRGVSLAGRTSAVGEYSGTAEVVDAEPSGTQNLERAEGRPEGGKCGGMGTLKGLLVVE